MRIAMFLLASILGLGLAGGCKKDKDKEPKVEGSSSGTMTGSGSDMGSGSAGSAGSGSATAMGSGSAAGSGSAGSGSGSADAAAMAHHAGMCPSTVFGSTTKADMSKDKKAVVLMITSDDKDAILAIQKRTGEILTEKKGTTKPADTHDKKGAHGGAIGICPVHVPEGAKTKAEKQAKGMKITITPKDNPDALKTEVDARIQKAADWVAKNIKPGDKGNSGGVGGGKGDHGMNHSGSGDSKGQERDKTGSGGGKGTGGGGGKGTGGGSGKGA